MLPLPAETSTMHLKGPTEMPIRNARRTKKMMKRKAEAKDSQDGPDGPENRQLMDIDKDGISTGMANPEWPLTISICSLTTDPLIAEEASSYIGSDGESTFQPHADTQTPPTPTIATDATTTASGRRKFPSELKTIPCTVPGCDKMFNRLANLQAHLRSHANERPFKCERAGCDKAYSDKKHLNAHVLSAHIKAAKFTCDQCGKGFATGQRLKRHALVHEGQERFRCRDYPPCTQTFRKHNTLQRHILKDHLGEKAWKCDKPGCTDSYDTLNALKRHTQREHGEAKFWCDLCTTAAMEAGRMGGADGVDTLSNPVGFTTQFQLEQHIRQEHVDCPFCDGLKFTGQFELHQHMETYHSGLTVKDRKTVRCEYEGCDKWFTKKSNMRAHYKNAHEGLRFVCGKVNLWEVPGLEDWNWTEEGCGGCFTHKAALANHVLYVHLGHKRPQYDGPSKDQKHEEADRRAGSGGGGGGGGVTFLDEISGVAERERRRVVCAVDGCAARFRRHHDLHLHMHAEHPEQAKFGLLGESEVPQPDYDYDGDLNSDTSGLYRQAMHGDGVNAGGVNEGDEIDWEQEDPMMFLDLPENPNPIDPSLLMQHN